MATYRPGTLAASRLVFEIFEIFEATIDDPGRRMKSAASPGTDPLLAVSRERLGR